MTNNIDNKKTNLEKKKKKKIDSDLITVIFIITMIVVVAVLFSLFNYNGNDTKLTGTKAEIEKQQEENTETIIITVGVSSIAIAAICIGYKIKTNRKKQRELEEKLRKQREFEDAVSRIKTKQNNTYSRKNNYEDVIKNKRNDRKFEYLDDDISYGNGVRHKYDFNNIELEDDEDDKYRDIIERFSDDGYAEGASILDRYKSNSKKKNRRYLLVGIAFTAVIVGGIIVALIVI